jgi:type I restriction enzyme M protein
VIRPIKGQAITSLYGYIFRSARFNDAVLTQLKGAQLPRIGWSSFAELQIPLPPLEVQKEIVAEIEGYQKVINGARAVLDHYRPHIPIHSDWPMLKLGEICDVRDGTHDSPKYVLEGYPLITSKNLKNGFIDFTDANLISREDLNSINKRSKVDAGDILMPMIGTIGNPVIADESREYAVKNVALIKFYRDSKIDNRFLKDVLASAEMQNHFEQQASGSTQKFISLGFIRAIPIPLPPLTTQQAIVAEIEAEQALVDANRGLIERFEKKIQATLARVWGE